MASVLVIDDDAMAGDLYTSLLRAFGYEAAFVTSGKEALVHLGSSKPDLIMLDIMMPDMNGLDLLKKLKSDEKTSSLQVAIFSALDESEWRERAAGAGACEYWIKGGFDFGELQDKIAACLNAMNRSPDAARETREPSPAKAASAAREVSRASAGPPKSLPPGPIASTLGDFPGMKKIIAEYVECLPAEIQKMQHYLDNGQMHPLRRIAHQLRGTGGGYGFDLISDLAGAVESAINADDPPESIAQKTNSLIDLIRRIEGFDERAAVASGNGGTL